MKCATMSQGHPTSSQTQRLTFVLQIEYPLYDFVERMQGKLLAAMPARVQRWFGRNDADDAVAPPGVQHNEATAQVPEANGVGVMGPLAV